MSHLNVFEDFEDEWDDFTPSLQDQLFENLEAEANEYNNDEHLLSTDFDSDLSSTKAAFDVFLDELFEIPHKVKASRMKKQPLLPLGELSTNQQHNNKVSLADHNKNKREEPKEDTLPLLGRPYDSQDENMWTDLDIDLFSNMEAKSNIDLQRKDEHSIQSGSFQTAAGRSIPPPPNEESQKAKIALKSTEENIPTKSRFESSPSVLTGFATASGKKLTPPSDQATLKALAVLSDAEEAQMRNKPVMKGFETASGKALKPVSEKAKERANALFKQLEQEDMKNTSGFKTASGKKLTGPTKESIELAAALLRETDEQNKGEKRLSDEPLNTNHKYENVLNQYGGFQMAHSRKGIEASPGAKRQAISIFEEREVPNIPTTAEQILDQDFNVTSIFRGKNTSSSYPTVPDINPSQGQESSLTKSKKLAEKSINTVPSLPKRNKHISAVQKGNKPFKSPIIKSNIELTKAAVKKKNVNKSKGISVFDLTCIPTGRYTLSSLGKPLQYTRDQLKSKNIPTSIINMTALTAKKYQFEGHWGYKEAMQDLVKAGAVSTRMSTLWIENHYGLIVWKFACLIRSYPDKFIQDWTSQNVLEQLLYRYEREFNMGHRPVLKKILEQDDISAKHMILVISDIIEIKSALFYNTSSKYQLQLSDGWYQVPACIDLRMEHAISKRRLKIGHKLSVCGAQIVGDRSAQSPLSISNSSTLLSITTNGCLPARWDTKLGYHKQKLIMRSIPTIFNDGGMVTALDIIVCRKYPMLYTETLSNGSMITRTPKEEETARREAQGYDEYGRQSDRVTLPNFRADQRKGKTSSHVDNRNMNSESKSFEDRKVSGYFKIRICDTKQSSPSQQQPLATLLLSNANELNHMDIIEGNRYKVFFIMPYHPKNKKYPGLDLKTTRMTRWEPAPAITNAENAYIPRYLSTCEDIRFEDGLHDFDLVVYVLHTGTATQEIMTGRKLWKQTLLVTDQSMGICRIDFRLPLNPFPEIKGQIMGLINVRYEMYDRKFDITCLKATDETELISKVSSIECIQKGVVQLKKWVHDNGDSIESINNRIRDIVQ